MLAGGIEAIYLTGTALSLFNAEEIHFVVFITFNGFYPFSSCSALTQLPGKGIEMHIAGLKNML